MVQGRAVSMPRVPIGEAQFATPFLGAGSLGRQRTLDPPSLSEAGGYDSPRLAAGLSHNITVPDFRVKLCDALPAQFQEDEDELQTAREDTANEKFFLEELGPPAWDVALPFGMQRQRTPTNNSGGFSGPPQRAGGVDCAKDLRGELKKSAAGDHVVSVGTLGHPHTCSEPCKYTRRKAGCLLGVHCSRCHLCHWRSERAGAALEQRLAAPALARTLAPPQPFAVPRPGTLERTPPPPPQAHEAPRLAEPTRGDQPAYVTLGASLSERPPPVLAAEAAAAGEGPPAAFCGSADCPSEGSIGHPLACQWACKYASKARGCKVGPSCNRCHLCHWKRSTEHAKQKLDVSGRVRRR